MRSMPLSQVGVHVQTDRRLHHIIIPAGGDASRQTESARGHEGRYCRCMGDREESADK